LNLYRHFVQKVREGHEAEKVKDGRFQAMMQVTLVNDGPVTLEVNADPKPVVAKTAVKQAGKQTIVQQDVQKGNEAGEPTAQHEVGNGQEVVEQDTLLEGKQ